MQDIFEQLKSAVKEGHPSYSCILFDNTHALASDGQLGARIPYETGVQMMADAKTIGKALKATRGKAEVEFDEKNLQLTFRSAKKQIEVSAVPPITFGKIGSQINPDATNWIPCNENFGKHLVTLGQVMSDDESQNWAMTVTLYKNHMFATNGKTLFFTETEHDDFVVFPENIVNFVRKSKGVHYPTHFAYSPFFVAFKYASGLEVSTRLIENPRAESIYGLIEKYVEPEYIVTDELRDAFLAACEIAQHVIEFDTHKVWAHSDSADFEEPIETPAEPGDIVQLDKDIFAKLLKGVHKMAASDPLCLVLDDGTKAVQARRRA